MKGEMGKAKKDEFLKENQKYAAAFDKDAADKLNEKIKSGAQLTKDEQLVADSSGYKNTYGDKAKNVQQINTEDFAMLLQQQKNLSSNANENPDVMINKARAALEAPALREAQRILADMNQKTFESSNEAAAYMKEVISNNEILARSSAAQNQVLLEIMDKLKNGVGMNDEVKAELTKLSVRSFETKQNTNIMVNNAISGMRQEKPVLHYRE
jgi:hypothetical protein